VELKLTAVFERVPEGYIGHVEELPGANTQAATLAEERLGSQAELRRLRAAVEALPDRAQQVQLVLFAHRRIREVEPAEALAFTAADLYDGPR